MATYHVAPGGSDSAAGSSSAPWATLQKAADTVVAGDTVIVHAGNYAGFNMGYDNSQPESPVAPITFRADPGVVIDQENDQSEDGIYIQRYSNVIVDGFNVVGMGRYGIYVTTGNRYVVRNNYVDQSANFGIHVSHAIDAVVWSNTSNNTVAQHGIYVANTGKRVVVANNTCCNNGDAGIQLNGDRFAIVGDEDGVMHNCVVFGNVLRNNGLSTGGSTINCVALQDSIIACNVLDSCRSAGITLYHGDGGGDPTNNLIAYNAIRVLYDYDFVERTGLGTKAALHIRQGGTGNKVIGNILYNNSPEVGSFVVESDCLTGLESDYNHVIDMFGIDGDYPPLTLAAWQNPTTGTGQDQHSTLVTEDQIDDLMAKYLARREAIPCGYGLEESHRGRS